jgi:hypothetical protein
MIIIHEQINKQYIGGQNVTNQATPQSPQQDGDKVISSSSLVHTGRGVDHNKAIFCCHWYCNINNNNDDTVPRQQNDWSL